MPRIRAASDRSLNWWSDWGAHLDQSPKGEIRDDNKPLHLKGGTCKERAGLQLSGLPKPFAAASGNMMSAWPEYVVDALQCSVLFLDLLRQRGNEEIEITSRPSATVLNFQHEVLMDGRSLSRPMNYTLSRIVPPSGIEIDPRKRPVVVVDPRAGQGPGVGGFKAESEIGDALNASHPVYFIASVRRLSWASSSWMSSGDR